MVMMKKCQYLTVSLVILIAINIDNADSELFTALADMEALLETENVLINNLESYIEAQEDKLEFLRR